MRTVVLISVIACFFITCVSESEAFFWGKKKESEQQSETQDTAPEAKETKKQATQKKAVNKKKTLSEKSMRQLKEKKRKQLDNSEWDIELSALTGKGQVEKDTVTFKNNQVSSANFSRKQFSATNYTLTVQDSGKVVWETMQTSETGGTVFWRGEITEDMEKMQGVISHHIDAQTTQDSSFSSTGKKTLAASD